MSKIQLPRNEEGEQIAFVHYLELLKNQGKVEKFTAIPNSTWTPSMKQKVKNKAMGVRAGFPDLLILLRYNVLCIEMKVKPNKPTPDQLLWLTALNKHLYIKAYVCYGYDGAKECIDQMILEERSYPKIGYFPDH